MKIVIWASFFNTKSTSRLPSRKVMQFQLLNGRFSIFFLFMQFMCFLSIQNLELHPLKTKDSISETTQVPDDGCSSNFSIFGPYSRSSLFACSSASICNKRPWGYVLNSLSSIFIFSSRVMFTASLTSIRLLKAFS